MATTSPTTLSLTAAPLAGTVLNSLDGMLGLRGSVLDGWTFAATGYTAGDPVYLSLDIGHGYSRNNLDVCRYDGSGWTMYPASDLTVGGTWTSFTVSTLDGYGYAVTTATVVPGDVNGDDRTDINDLTIVLANFGQTTGISWSTGDLNGDGHVDLNDLTIVLANYGQMASGSASIGMAPCPSRRCCGSWPAGCWACWSLGGGSDSSQWRPPAPFETIRHARKTASCRPSLRLRRILGDEAFLRNLSSLGGVVRLAGPCWLHRDGRCRADRPVHLDKFYGGFVGDTASGTLTVDAGSGLLSSSAYIGYSSTATGTLTIDGAGSTWTNGNRIYVGLNGSGTLSITNGGTVTCPIGYPSIGYATGSTGMVAVDGAGSTWTASPNICVGQSGTGTLAITNGGSVSVRRNLRRLQHRCRGNYRFRHERWNSDNRLAVCVAQPVAGYRHDCRSRTCKRRRPGI